jgi:aminoglycoside phosphotransferase (APT) family kinase protein
VNAPALPAASAIDIDALRAWLSPRLAGDWSALRVTPFTNGQSNPTFLLAAGDTRYVLRKKPPGVLLPSAHAIDREYRVISALGRTGFPVPRPELYCEDAGVIGTPFYVMEHVAGLVTDNPALPAQTPAQRTAIYAAMADVLARLHTTDPDAAGLADFGRRDGYYARQVSRWAEQYRRSATDPMPAMDRLIAWLQAHLPAAERSTIVHGDYRMENLVVDPATGTVRAVLDWELATLGDPHADLAYCCLWFRLPRHAFGGLAGLPLAELGIPDEATFVARYARATGRDGIPGWNFHVAFAFFRLAAILQGILRRALDGNAAAPDAMARGRLAPLCADLGCAAIDTGD